MYLAPSLDDALGIVTHPDIYPFISDDGSVDAKDYKLPDGVMTVVCYDPDPVACTVFYWRNAATVETHVQVLPDARKRAFGYGRAMVAWIFDNMPVQKIIGLVHDRKTLLYTLKIGFKIEGVSKGSFLKNNKLIDETYIGLRKELWH